MSRKSRHVIGVAAMRPLELTREALRLLLGSPIQFAHVDITVTRHNTIKFGAEKMVLETLVTGMFYSWYLPANGWEKVEAHFFPAHGSYDDGKIEVVLNAVTHSFRYHKNCVPNLHTGPLQVC